MEKIAFIVDRLNMPPFNKGFNTMTEFDSKSSLELLDICCEIIATINPDQEAILKETTEFKVHTIISFLVLMKFNIPDDQMDDFRGLLMNGDKEILQTIMHWCLQRFENLQKRAYLAKYLVPVDIPMEFMNDDLIIELSQHLKDLQAEFKEIHKLADKLQVNGNSPADLKAQITQLELERTQLQNKIQKMKKEAQSDEAYFQQMLKVTSLLRKEQEEEVRLHEKLRELRHAYNDIEHRHAESTRRLAAAKAGGAQNQSAEQLLNKLQQDVRELTERRDALESSCADRETHLNKLQGWENSDKITTEEDVRQKREQVRDAEEEVTALQRRLDDMMDRNPKLVVFRQASTVARKKLNEKVDELDKLLDEKRLVQKLYEEKENESRLQGQSSGRVGKNEMKKFTAQVRDKLEVYRRMREDLSALRAELVILQSTEQTLKNKHKNIDEFLTELEKKKGVTGYRENQRAIIEMTEKSSNINQMKSETLEEISKKVDDINQEFRTKHAKLAPLIQNLKSARQEHMDVETEYNERKSTYDKVAVGLEMEKQALEKECDDFQEECLREESRYHYLHTLIFLVRSKIERAEQEKKHQNKDGRLMRDFASLKEFYANKINQQDQMTKQLRINHKKLKENSEVMTNQKTNFLNLQALMTAKLRAEQGNGMKSGSAGGAGIDSFAVTAQIFENYSSF